MSVVSESIIKRIKRNFQIIFAEQVSDEFEEECQKSFLKFIDFVHQKKRSTVDSNPLWI